MAPLNLGIARICWEYSWSLRYRSSPIFSDFLGRVFLITWSVPSRHYPIFTDFSDFLGRLLVIVEFYSRDYLFTWLHVFF